jgi:hypothetical protein
VSSDTIRDRNMNRKELDAWLMAEQGGEDDTAEAAFAHVFAAVPRVEPSSMFVQHAVSAAWRWRARRRRLLAVTWTVAVALVVAAASTAYLAWPIVAGSAVKSIAFISGHIVPWLVAYATVALRGWLTLGHVGAVIAGALMTPERVAALVGVELVGILAFYALQRIAGSARFGDAQV